MKRVQTFSTRPNHFDGPTANRQLLTRGKIDICFHVTDTRVDVYVAGYPSPHSYTPNVSSKWAKERNAKFIQRYVAPCHNAQELIKTVFN